MDKDRNSSTLINANGKFTTEISLEGPSGVVTGEKISGYNDNKKLSSLSQGIKVDRILTNVEEKTVNSEMIIMNNSETDMKNVSVLGRIPFEGNKSIVTDEVLGTTIDTKMVSDISQIYGVYKDVDIYYSENETATKDLKDESNKWTKDYKNLKEVKSFLIVYKDDLKVGEVTTFSYNYIIPKELECNQSIYSSFAVYYVSDGQDNVQESDVLGLETVKTPKIEVHITSNAGVKVTEGQMVKYTVTVENKGEVKAENVAFNLDIPKGSTYVKYVKADGEREGYYKKDPKAKQLKIDVGDISAGEEKVYNYSVLVNETASVLDKAEVQATVEGLNEEKTGKPSKSETPNGKDEENNTIENENTTDTPSTEEVAESKTFDSTNAAEVETAEVEVNFKSEFADLIVTENKELNYSIFVRNNTNLTDNQRTMKNVKIKMAVPEGTTVFRAYEGVSKADKDDKNTVIEIGSYDEDERKYVLNLNELKPEESIDLEVVLKTNYLDGETKKDIVSSVTVDADGFSTVNSQSITSTICRPIVNTTFVSNSNSKYLKPGDDVKFTFRAENNGEVTTSGLSTSFSIPEGFKPVKGIFFLSTSSEIQDMNLASIGIGIANLDIGPGETLVAEYTLEAEEIQEKEKTITSFVTLSADNIKNSFETEKIVHIIQNDTEEDIASNNEETESTKPKATGKTGTTNAKHSSAVTTNAEKAVTEKYYRISGKAWEDSNKNGMRDSSEKGIKSIGAKLYNAETNKVVNQTNTNDSGEYTFSQVEAGKYYIIFTYDKSKYALTEYQKEGVDASKNSDAIVTSSLAITDIITISSVSAGDIDIGLTDPLVFDLKLSKTIDKVTVNTKKGTKEYKYNKSSLAKVDIHAKELSGAKVYVEYVITVSNKGEIPGYAKSIVDYVPKGMTFESNLNKDWYEKNGKLYCKALSKQEIKPGSAKSVRLILVKQMTTTNTGTTSNNAEIAESFNTRAIEDIDSVAGNTNDSEDDYSTADVIVSVRTGGTLLNITALAISLGIAVLIGYLFKKSIIERMRRW